jgi:transcriptional regulator with XRE-family HTH domain
MLGEKLQQALKTANISVYDAANHIGISEANLYKLFKKDSFEVAYLRKAANLLGLPLSYFFDEDASTLITATTQTGTNNQAGSGNTQKIKTSSKAPAHELASQLDSCLRDNQALKNQLLLANALVAAKDETISLLRGGYNRPN